MRILFICTTPNLLLYVIRALPTGGYVNYCLGPKDQTARWSRFCKRYFVSDPTEIESGGRKITDKINRICQTFQIDCVVPLDIAASLGVTKQKRNLKAPVFPLASEKIINLFNNKWSTAKFLARNKINHPTTKLIRAENELSQTTFPKPFLIKPTSLSGGKGIVRITKADDLVAYINTPSPYKLFPLLVQEEIKGTNIDVSVLASRGQILAWTIQRWHKPGEIEFIKDNEALAMVAQVVRLSGYSGLMHADMCRERITNQLTIFECNPRAWGSIGASILTGTNFVAAGQQAAQGEKVSEQKSQLVTYEAPLNIVLKILKNPLNLAAISAASLSHIARALTDPLPYFAFGLNAIGGRLGLFPRLV